MDVSCGQNKTPFLFSVTANFIVQLSGMAGLKKYIFYLCTADVVHSCSFSVNRYNWPNMFQRELRFVIRWKK